MMPVPVVAQTETEHASNLRQRLVSATATTKYSSPSPNLPYQTITTAQSVDTTHLTESNPPLQTSNGPLLQSPHPVTSFTNSSTSSGEQKKKAAAAAMAEKLASSTSSAQMLTSFLSSLVAEGAAPKNGSLSTGIITSSMAEFPAEKMPRLEKTMPVANIGNGYFGHLPQQMGSMPLSLPQISVSGIQPPPPFQPPLPPVPPPQMHQFVQTTGGMIGVGPYGNPPPPTPSVTAQCIYGVDKARCSVTTTTAIATNATATTSSAATTTEDICCTFLSASCNRILWKACAPPVPQQ